MSASAHQHHVSVSGAHYAALKDYARTRGVSIASVLEEWIATLDPNAPRLRPLTAAEIRVHLSLPIAPRWSREADLRTFLPLGPISIRDALATLRARGMARRLNGKWQRVNRKEAM